MARSGLLDRLICLAMWTAPVALLSAGSALAGQAWVLDVQVEAQQNGLYGFTATVRHSDEGWSHYADRWEVLAPDGSVLGTRTLYHPHDKNVPFTRSLSNVSVPVGVKQVQVKAHCSVHGDGAGNAVFTVDLPPR